MKTILITGSNSDIGIAIAKALTYQPLQLALQYYSNQAKANELQVWLNGKNVRSHLFQCDLTDPRQAKSLIEQTLAAFDSIDVLINVIGPFVYKDILDVTPEEWFDDVNLNLHTCFYTSHYALDELRRNQGQIINFAFSGVENIKARSMSAGYCAAKTGIAVLTKSLAAALAPHKVRVNAICPGLVEEGHISSEERQQMANQIPYGRPVHPDEIGKTTAWLVWDSPESMTGSLITVAGAWEY